MGLRSDFSIITSSLFSPIFKSKKKLHLLLKNFFKKMT